jgi:hypothetical protein
MDIRHRFCNSPSQELQNTVTFLRNQAGVDSRFALPVTAEGVSHRISGSANPEVLSPAATGKTNNFSNNLNLYFMANANNSIITGKFKGSLGKQLVFRDWEGKTIVAKSPKGRSGDPTAAQAETQEKFLVGSRYAKSVINSADQSMAQAYARALRPRQNVYSRALEDFMSPPVVKLIDTRNYTGVGGDKIVTRAVDDFRVARVQVEIYAADGTLLEAGNAQQNLNGIDWTYTVTQDNPAVAGLAGTRIKAIAFDVPGNEGTLEVTL